MTKLKLAFLGVGNMGQCAHLRNYVTLSDCEVVAVAEPKQQLARLVAQRYNIPRVYPDAAALLGSEKVDALVCIQPFTMHGRILPAALASGLPVLTEKPMASTVKTGRSLLELARKHNSRWFVAYHKRSDPATMHAMRLIDQWRQSRRYGKLRYVRVTMPPGDWSASGFAHLIRTDEPAPIGAADPPASNMSDAHFNALVTFVNYYIHQVNLLRHLLGEPYKVAHADSAGLLLVAQSESGLTATIEMQPFITRTGWQEQALVCFDRAWIRIDLPAPMVLDQPGSVTVYTDDEGQATTSNPTLPPVHAMRQQAMNFLAMLRGQATPLCSADLAIEDLIVAEDYVARMQPK